MHFIQKHILDELRSADSMRYAQLNSQDVESGHFRYHLSQLVKDGYVEQLDRGVYSLTTQGQSYVDKLSEKRVNPHAMPKVITYTLLRDGEKYLLQEKQKQPYMGLLNMIGGKLHEGETAQNAAIREVHEKTGITIVSPKLAGIFEILIRNDSDLLSHVIAHVFTADIESADYTKTSLQAFTAEGLTGVANPAPDLLPIFDKIQNAQDICVETLEVIM